MLRVLHVLSSIGTPGGVQSLLWNYYQKMDSDEIIFDFVVHNNEMKGFEQKFLNKGSQVFYVPPKKKNIIAHIYELDKILSTEKYNIVHTHQDFLGYLTLFLAYKNGIKIRILHSHKANLKENFLKKLRRKILTQFALRLATDLFACGKDAAIWTFGEQKYFHDEVFILHNAVNPEAYVFNNTRRTIIRNRLHIQDATLVIGNVARFTHQKNHKFLINCFIELNKTVPDSLLLLIGEGELLENIKQQVYEANIENKVLFLGNRSDVPDLLQAMDVFVLTSIFEGLPLTMVEAQISDLACVVSDIITDEIKINNKTQYLSLNDSFITWAHSIENSNLEKRENRLKESQQCNFDVNIESKKLFDYYIRCNVN